MCTPPQARECPRCGSDYEPPGATSRADDLTEVCPTCGVEEAIRDAAALPRLLVEAWPVDSRGGVPFPEATFTAIRGEYTVMAEAAGRKLAPAEHWLPVLLLEGREERRIVGLGDLLSSDGPKAFAAQQLLPALARTFGTRMFGLVFTAWLSRPAPGGPIVAPSADPARIEAIVVSVGDAERHEVWVAEVERSADKPPAIRDWDRLEGIDSPLVDPLRRAIGSA